MKGILIVMAAVFSTAAFGQDAATLHGTDYAALLADLLAFVGGSAILRTIIPGKWLLALGPIKMLVEFISANFLNAKNVDATSKYL